MRWHTPVDPECPTVSEYASALFNDPMTAAMGAPTGEIMEDFERKHMPTCKRCQEYGAANVDIV